MSYQPQPPVVPPSHGQQFNIYVGAPATRPFQFDGGAGSYLGIGILAALLIFFTFGLATPWAVCMQYRWRTEHTIVNGRRLRFTGTGMGLFGNWIKWWLLLMITCGIYGFWVIPRVTRWAVEHQDFS